MTDDLDYNLKLIKLIEKRKVLYDHTADGNSNRLTQELAWKEVAQELGENMTACKERWTNIRNCYTRHLRSKATHKVKKPYYLSKYLEFVYPFCKVSPHTCTTPSKPQTGCTKPDVAIIHKVETIDYEELDETSNDTSENNINEIQSEHIYLQDSNDTMLENDTNETRRKESRDQVYNECADSTNSRDQRNQKRKSYPAEGYSEEQVKKKNVFYGLSDDPDLIFFKSLLPDLHRMSNKQKIRLKLAVLKEINNVLYPDDSESDPLLITK